MTEHQFPPTEEIAAEWAEIQNTMASEILESLAGEVVEALEDTNHEEAPAGAAH